ncbi:VWA domain-containing protein [bacterium]|nr:MAG: VWA domain-containing protein [bacterium]
MKAIGSRITRMTIVGGCAALCAALPLALFLPLTPRSSTMSVLFGLILGGFLAGFLTAFELLWTQRTGLLTSRLVPSAVMGAFGGALGALAGNMLFKAWGNHLVSSPSAGIMFPLSLGSAAGWGLTGLGVGLAITLPFSSARSRWIHASFGGMAGGIAGGLIMQVFRPLMGSGSLVLGLLGLGSAVGFGISWTEKALSSLRLQVLQGPGRGSEFTLGGSTLIGNDKNCAVRLTEAGVAPRHARIFYKARRLFFEDLGSPLGSTLNDRKVAGTSASLSHGDLIRVGRSLLRVNAPDLSAGTGSTVAFSAILLSLSLLTPAPAGASQVVQTSDATKEARITQFDTSRYPIVDLYATLPGTLRPGTVRTLEVREGDLESTLLEVRDLQKGVRDVPLTISLVVDTSESMRGQKLQEAKDAIFSFSQTIPSQARINLVAFSDHVRVLSTGLPSSLIYRSSSELSADGHTALFDAINTGVSLLDDKSGRKVVLTITDGIANRGSVSMDEAVISAESKGVSLLFVGLGSDARRNRLEDMARRTGGKAVFTSNPLELSSLFEAFAMDLSREVLIRYRSPGSVESVVPVTLHLGSGATGSYLESRYLSPQASFFGVTGTSSIILFVLGLLGPAGLFAASRLTSFNMGKAPVLLVEGSSQATRLLTKVLTDEGMTVPMAIGGQTVLVNNQPVKSTRTLKGGETLTWGETTILFRKN